MSVCVCQRQSACAYLVSVCRHFLHKHIHRHAQIPSLRSLKHHSGETVHQSSLCRHEVIIRTVAQSRLPTLSLMSTGSHRTMNTNLVIMNRVHSVTVFSHTSAIRHADGKGDELLFFLYWSSPHSLPVSGEKWFCSSVFSARSNSRYLIIILSAARAQLIDVPLNCLLQARDLTKALSST